MVCLTTGAAQRTSQSCRLRVRISEQCRTGVRHHTRSVSYCHVGPFIKRARWQLRLSEFNFETFHLAGVKHQATDELSGLLTTAADDSSIESDVPVVLITDAQLEGKNTETDANIWHILLYIDGVDPVKPGQPQF